MIITKKLFTGLVLFVSICVLTNILTLGINTKNSNIISKSSSKIICQDPPGVSAPMSVPKTI